MKFAILSISVFLFSFCFKKSIYDIRINKLDGVETGMSAFIDKKILITTVSAVKPRLAFLQFLDSLKKADKELIVMVVPAADFEDKGNEVKFKNLNDSLKSEIIFTKEINVKKIAGNNQHELFKWLTHAEENGHFDIDVDVEEQMFILNRKGTLYSVLPKEAPDSVKIQALNQPVED